MEIILIYVLGTLGAYLLGSVPFGLLIGFARGKDIRTLGSKNIGATNVFRTVGKGWGVLALLCDFAKGCVPVVLARMFIPAGEATMYVPVAVGVAAVVGHNWTCFLGFKGGKGIATSAGILAGLSPWGLLFALAAFVIVVAISRYVSLASICAAVTLGIVAWPIHFCATESFGTAPRNIPLVIVLDIMAFLAVYKHKANIGRLRAGTESKIF